MDTLKDILFWLGMGLAILLLAALFIALGLFFDSLTIALGIFMANLFN